MKRRRFVKTLMAAAMAVMIPLQFTEFGSALAFEPVPIVPLASMVKIPLATIDASAQWMQKMYRDITRHASYKDTMFKEGLTNGML